MRSDADTSRISPLGLTCDRYVEACRDAGIGAARATGCYTRYYREGVGEGPAAGAEVAPIVKRLTEPGDEGVTTKFCQRLNAPDAGRFAEQGVPHLDIESVIIPMVGRTSRRSHTLCVSSQVGCAMGCEFCETAQMGLVRSLTPAEIVGQWWAATHLEGAEIDNIVFMGMGEPLDNLDAVLDAIACLTDHRGAAVPMSNITISTVGRVDGLRKLIDVVQQPGWKRLGLALSVNAPNDEVRNAIMPLNKRWGMAELRDTMVELSAARSNRKLLFEYVLIPGVNDAPEHAGQLAEWLSPFLRAERGKHIGLLNVIPYNPRRNSPWPAPDEDDVTRFVDDLRDLGVYAKRRRTKGRTSMAACGQLGTEDIRKRQYVPVTTTGATRA
ncbi:MAG: hypothetical protein DHS20C14_15430 [Phycisphaeraceae bacterium]|nr:MAG: hypothetical protein DHS20C14_15430 [Phycisphaeraceae bacterium]